MPRRPDMRKLIVTGLSTGYLPIAPGTWGSAAAGGLYLLAAYLSGGDGFVVNGAMIVLTVAAATGCIAFGRFAEEAFGRKDPPQCTLDEWAGQGVALLLLPRGTHLVQWGIIAAVAFVAFRIFDIIKPPPARSLERLPHGWGILADDLVAGVYANILAQVLLRWWVL